MNMDDMVKQSWYKGFAEKCAEENIDVRKLIEALSSGATKRAQFFDPDNAMEAMELAGGNIDEDTIDTIMNTRFQPPYRGSNLPLFETEDPFDSVRDLARANPPDESIYGTPGDTWEDLKWRKLGGDEASSAPDSVFREGLDQGEIAKSDYTMPLESVFDQERDTSWIEDLDYSIPDKSLWGSIPEGLRAGLIGAGIGVPATLAIQSLLNRSDDDEDERGMDPRMLAALQSRMGGGAMPRGGMRRDTGPRYPNLSLQWD